MARGPLLMSLRGRWFRLASVIGVLCSAAASPAETYYSLLGGSGAQFQVGNDFFVPIRTGGSSSSPSMSMFPPLSIPRNADPAKARVKQTRFSNGSPLRITIPPGAFRRPAAGARRIGVAKRNPQVLQVQTNADFSAPVGSSAVLEAGGRSGPPDATFFGPEGSAIRYHKTVAQFGGRLQFQLASATPVRVWIPALDAMLPCKHPALGGSDPNCMANRIEQPLGTIAAIGAKFGTFIWTTAGPPPKSPHLRAISVPNTTGAIAKSVAFDTKTETNKLGATGFPWTTGRVAISVPAALGGKEAFTITGMDSRVNGVGGISLVSGALSNRHLTGANASRGWLRLNLPEPAAALGAGAAIAALAICHGLARRHASGGR
jgi:hypothetical protein